MVDEDLKQLHIIVTGRVQGVFFRDNTRAIASNLDLTGYARNLPDGRVEILAQGKKSGLRQLLDWCYRGSLLAKVDGLAFTWSDVTERTYGKFVVDREGKGFFEDKAEAAKNLTKRVLNRAERKIDKIFPKHIAIIPDGDRRWAVERGLPTWEGHEAGMHRAIEIIRTLKNSPVTHLTMWGFSTDNWSRDKKEVDKMMSALLRAVRHFKKELLEAKIAFHHFGRKDRLPKKVLNEIKKAEEETAQFTERHLAIALDYGGKDEIVRMINKLRGQTGVITEAHIEENLDTYGFPDPDLIIRTSGERRLSGLMPWQSVHSEFYFSPLYFPDFTPVELALALDDFSERKRRFGGG